MRETVKFGARPEARYSSTSRSWNSRSSPAVSAPPPRSCRNRAGFVTAPRPTAEEPAPQKESSGGGFSLGWLLIVVAIGVGAAAFFAWRWLGKDDNKEWEFEDIPSDTTP